MKKRLFCIFMTLLMLCNLSFYAVAQEENTLVLHNGDTVFGNFRVEQDEQKGKCLVYQFDGRANSLANAVSFQAVDATGRDTLAVDIYVSDPAAFANITQMYVEITSSGTCDYEESAWTVHTVFTSGKLKQGWNTVYFYLSDSGGTNGECNLSAINYFRIYGDFNGKALTGHTLKIDNIRMVYTGGYDYSDLSMEAYRGDNPTVDIRIEGQSVPDLSRRDENITVVVGR